MPPTYVYGQVSLDFKLKDSKVARATFKYKYFAKDDALAYVGIEYDDPRLQELVDGNAQVRERVDRYIRSLLAKKN